MKPSHIGNNRKMKKILLTALVVLVISACTSTISTFVYEGAKSDVPNTSAMLSEDAESINWHFNPHIDKTLAVSEYSWHKLHRGNENEWSWEILGTDNFTISSTETENWDRLLSKLTQYSVAILPKGIDTNISIYLVPGPEKQVSISTPNVPGQLNIPFMLWSKSNAQPHLPDLFGEQSQLIGDLGSTIQLGYYEKDLVPHPNGRSASQLKKYANSSCWRLAVRPALAIGTDNKVKVPAISDYTLDLMEDIYKSNESEVEATMMYGSTLLISDADEYMASLDLNWPQSGRDELEINALLDFCKLYLANNGDPRQ